MVNHSLVISMKEETIKTITSDDAIVSAIDADISTSEAFPKLIGSHVFHYHKSPAFITQPITYLNVLVHTRYKENSKKFVTAVLEIWIYSHIGHAQITDSAGVIQSRNDHIAKLLDKALNQCTVFNGIGSLQLVSNTEGAFDQNFVYRSMIFEVPVLSNAICEG